jgi:hypothetical protein
MLNRILAPALACALIFVALPLAVSAKSNPEKDAAFTEKVKAGVIKLGVGPDAKVEVKLRNKTKLSGFISEANQDTFVITARNGTNTVIAYTDVGQVKGNNLTRGTKILLIGAIVAGTLAIIYFAAFKGKHF